MNYQKIFSYLKKQSNKTIAAHSQRFFKTGRGEYGQGDVFLGIRVPVLRKAVKQFKETPLSEIRKLLRSEYHEVRLLALLLLVHQFEKADEARREKIVSIYLKCIRYINHWDLVDSSAPYIVGVWLLDKDRSVLYDLAQSKSIWKRRIAIISTFCFIKQGEFNDALKISVLLLEDPEDLIHKAAGWMLREIGNRNRKIEEQFLKLHYRKMPRTMLRYAIEKFSEPQRQAYLKTTV